MLGRVLDVVAHVAMLSVATVKIVLIGILANDLRTNVLVIGKTEIVSSNNFELRHTDVSNGHVIHRMKTRSKLECAISCQIEPRCKTFLYEAPSSVCSIYREVTQYGCFEPVAQNVSRYFIERRTSWLMIMYQVHTEYISVYNSRTDKWEDNSIKMNLNAVIIDSSSWMIYWADGSTDERGIYTSDVMGNNRKILVRNVKCNSIAFDYVQRRLFYNNVKTNSEYLGMFDIDENKMSVFERGDGKRPFLNNIRVLPERRLVFWTDDNKLWRRRYNESEHYQISAFTPRDIGFTVDTVYNRLMWIQSGTNAIVWTDTWGQDKRVVEYNFSKQKVSPSFFAWKGHIYVTIPFTFNVSILNCRGEIVAWIHPRQKLDRSDRVELVWIPEHVYRST